VNFSTTNLSHDERISKFLSAFEEVTGKLWQIFLTDSWQLRGILCHLVVKSCAGGIQDLGRGSSGGLGTEVPQWGLGQSPGRQRGGLNLLQIYTAVMYMFWQLSISDSGFIQ